MTFKLVQLRGTGTTWQKEILGGTTTFMTMGYIIFVQATILQASGMDPGAVMVATCLASALATFCMGLLANYPIAMAPGMGHNVFFSYTVVLTLGYTWQQALGATFISGALFLLLSCFRLRENLIRALPDSLKNAFAVGIGLLITLVGLQWSGLVADHPATLVGLGDLTSAPVLLSLFGLSITTILITRGWHSAILIGVLLNLLAGLGSGLVQYEGILGPVPSLAPTLFQLDIPGALGKGIVSIILLIFLLDLFDTVGTLSGVGQQAGFFRPEGSLPRAGRALFSDAVGTVFGALCGTSTVTSYIESAAGISAGARTGLANLVTGSLFLVALFFAPLIKMVSGGVETADGVRLYPIVAPALVVVGFYMLTNVKKIPWKDPGEAIPAFLTIIMIPLTFSITDGMAFGFIAYVILKAVQGEIREVPLLIVICSLLFLLRYLMLA